MLDAEKDGEKSDDTWLDLSDEDSCNWMMFVRPAQNHLEQNLVAYQYGSEIFYTTIKNIQPKQELKVTSSSEVKYLVIAVPDIFLRSWWRQSRAVISVFNDISSCRCGMRHHMQSLSIKRSTMLQKKRDKVSPGT